MLFLDSFFPPTGVSVGDLEDLGSLQSNWIWGKRETEFGVKWKEGVREMCVWDKLSISFSFDAWNIQVLWNALCSYSARFHEGQGGQQGVPLNKKYHFSEEFPSFSWMLL